MGTLVLDNVQASERYRQDRDGTERERRHAAHVLPPNALVGDRYPKRGAYERS